MNANYYKIALLGYLNDYSGLFGGYLLNGSMKLVALRSA